MEVYVEEERLVNRISTNCCPQVKTDPICDNLEEGADWVDLEEGPGLEVVDLGEAWEAGLEEVWEVDLEDVVAVVEDSVEAGCSCDPAKLVRKTCSNALSGFRNNAILYLYRCSTFSGNDSLIPFSP